MKKLFAFFVVSLCACGSSGVSSTDNKQDSGDPNNPPSVVAPLTCVAPGDGGLVSGVDGGDLAACGLGLQQSKGFIVRLVSNDCSAHNNILIKSPVDAKLTDDDACALPPGTEWRYNGPFPANVAVSIQVTSQLTEYKPSLVATGEYPTWHIAFEDGKDIDFNDLIIDVIAIQ
jgi:hypothetical protein